MDVNTEQKVRERAYAIWVQSGCAEGQADRHWCQAEHEIRTERASAAEPSTPNARAAAEKTPSSPKQASSQAPGRSRSKRAAASIATLTA